MEFFIYLVVRLVDVFLSVILFAMLARAIMSFLMIDEDNKISLFLFSITEPFIFPVRALFERLGLFQGTPLDASFFITCLLLAIIRTVLQFIPV